LPVITNLRMNDTFVFTAMGSECILNLHDADTALAKAAEDEIFRIERRYSRYRADSILADINRASAMGGSIEVDEETASLLDYAFACHRKSRGLFDITTGALRRVWNFPGSKVPEAAAIERLLAVVGLEKVIWSRPLLSFPLAGVELDFGGICKEYAADRAAAICSEGGVASGFVNLGGDISVIGPRPDGTPWPIKIRDPRATDKSHAVIHLSKGGLATSGDYERCITFGGKRYSHILNPRTGWPSSGLSSVSIVAETCLLAGSVASLAMLMGLDGPAWLSGLGVAHLWTDDEGANGGSGFSVQPDSRLIEC
jgi:FAD:protein FMN transferase